MAYCSSKGALLSMAKSLAVAWGKDNIQASSGDSKACVVGEASGGTRRHTYKGSLADKHFSPMRQLNCTTTKDVTTAL